MKKWTKWILVMVLALCVSFLCQTTANARVVASGQCGAYSSDNVVWSLDDQGTLTISGKGDMKDYGYVSADAAPWQDLRVKTIDIKEGVLSIGKYAFADMCGVKSVALPKTMKSIGKYAFSNCTALHEVKGADALENIDEFAFEYCTNLEGLYPYFVKLKYLGDYAFQYCTSLRAVAFLGHDFTEIKPRTFDHCSSLWSVQLPDSLTWIDMYAFSNCMSLERLRIPASVKGLHENFMSRSGIREVWYYSSADVDENTFNTTYLKTLYISESVSKSTRKKLELDEGTKLVLIDKKQKITTKKINTYKASNLKKKAVSFSLGAKTNGEVKLSYQVISGNKKYIKVSAKGKVTLKKGCKKGTYVIRITAKKNEYYYFRATTKDVKIRVK